MEGEGGLRAWIISDEGMAIYMHWVRHDAKIPWRKADALSGRPSHIHTNILPIILDPTSTLYIFKIHTILLFQTSNPQTPANHATPHKTCTDQPPPPSIIPHKSILEQTTPIDIGPVTNNHPCFLPPFPAGSIATMTAVLAVLIALPSS